MFIIKQYRPGPFNKHGAVREFEQGLLEVGKLIQKDFESTVAHWDNKPEFQVVTSFGNNNKLEVHVYTESQVYIWLNNGVPPHTITPSDSDVLAFHEGYTAKTDPGIVALGSTFVGEFGGLGLGLESSLRSVQDHPGGESGGMVFTREVFHPGIEARNFDLRIRAGRMGTVEAIMRKATDGAAKKSGHWFGGVDIKHIFNPPGVQPVFSLPTILPTNVDSIPSFRGSYNFVSSELSSSLSSIPGVASFRGLHNFLAP